MNSLILVDIQNDFSPSGSLPVPEGDQVIFPINKLQPHFDLVVATKDWHPIDHKSFAKEHGKNPGDKILLNGIEQILWPVHCVQNSWGAEFIPGLETALIDRIFEKGIDRYVDSYSGFFDNDHKTQTGLDTYLKNKGVREVYLTGLATDYCVMFTAKDALMLGYETYVIKDATRGVNLNEGDVEKALEEMEREGIKIVESSNIIVKNS
jgi:nicotinamidase/pyrazinamidase